MEKQRLIKKILLHTQGQLTGNFVEELNEMSDSELEALLILVEDHDLVADLIQQG